MVDPSELTVEFDAKYAHMVQVLNTYFHLVEGYINRLYIAAEDAAANYSLNGPPDADKLRFFVTAVDRFEKACRDEAAKRDVHKASKGDEMVIVPIEWSRRKLLDIRKDKLLKGGITFHGELEIFMEQATEGAMWSVYEDGKTGYEGLQSIDEGDLLTIYAEDGTVLFDDIIVKDTKTGWRPYRADQPYGGGKQIAGGYAAHWIQQGMHPDEWAKLFDHQPAYRARLIKRT